MPSKLLEHLALEFSEDIRLVGYFSVVAVCVLASVYALAIERRIPAPLLHTPRVDSLAGVPGTMPNMALATDDPLSTDAQPAPHPADEASRIRGGGSPAPGTTLR